MRSDRDEAWARDWMSRYQHQNLLVRFWRCRHLLVVPFYALRSWLHGDSTYTFMNYWSIEHGMAHLRMRWLHDWDFVREELNERT